MADEIIKVLNDIAAKFGMSINWASDNVLPYLKDLMGRYIQYEIMSSIINIVIFFVLAFFMIFLMKKIHKDKEFGMDDCDPFGRYLCYFLLSCALIGWIIGVIANTKYIVACKTIPEKVVYDHIIDQMDYTEE